MVFTALAAGAGLLIGLLSGGSLKRLGDRRFLLWPLLPIGVLVQLPWLDALGYPGLLASYACLLAFAVAPGLSQAALRAALRERIDPVFMPRPLLLVQQLPRNSTGKLPREALQALAQTHDQTGRGRHAG